MDAVFAPCVALRTHSNVFVIRCAKLPAPLRLVIFVDNEIHDDVQSPHRGLGYCQLTDSEPMRSFEFHHESAMIHPLTGNGIFRVYDAGSAGVLHSGLLNNPA